MERKQSKDARIPPHSPETTHFRAQACFHTSAPDSPIALCIVYHCHKQLKEECSLVAAATGCYATSQLFPRPRPIKRESCLLIFGEFWSLHFVIETQMKTSYLPLNFPNSSLGGMCINVVTIRGENSRFLVFNWPKMRPHMMLMLMR